MASGGTVAPPGASAGLGYHPRPWRRNPEAQRPCWLPFPVLGADRCWWRICWPRKGQWWPGRQGLSPEGCLPTHVNSTTPCGNHAPSPCPQLWYGLAPHTCPIMAQGGSHLAGPKPAPLFRPHPHGFLHLLATVPACPGLHTSLPGYSLLTLL